MNWNHNKTLNIEYFNKNFLMILFLVGMITIGGCQDKGTETKISVIQDSVLIFKTDTTKFYSLTSIDPETGKWKPEISKNVNYHKINTRDKSLTFFFQPKNQSDWDLRKMQYDSLSIEKNGTSFYYTSDYFVRTFLDTLNSKTIAHVLDEDHYIRFTNLKRVSRSELEKLQIIKKVSSKNQNQQIKSNQIAQTSDFEFSEYWRKEAFKKSVEFIQKALSEQKPKCTMVKRSSYNPAKVKYIGNQGMQVKLYAEYDCNQDYINPAYFWVNAYYNGNGQWTFELEDHKLTH